MKRFLFALGLVLTAFAARAAEPSIEVRDGWVRLPPPGAPAAAYFTLQNKGEAITLRGVHTSAAGMAMIHGTEVENGMAKMRHLDSLQIGKGGVVQLAPGGTHVMLMHLKSRLQEGDSVELVLQFDGGDKRVSLPVKKG